MERVSRPIYRVMMSMGGGRRGGGLNDRSQ
jgi:hypothetical protein